MKEYLKYGIYATGAGIIIALAGVITQTDWILPIGILMAFGGFIAWRKDKKKRRITVAESIAKYKQKWEER